MCQATHLAERATANACRICLPDRRTAQALRDGGGGAGGGGGGGEGDGGGGEGDGGGGEGGGEQLPEPQLKGYIAETYAKVMGSSSPSLGSPQVPAGFGESAGSWRASRPYRVCFRHRHEGTFGAMGVSANGELLAIQGSSAVIRNSTGSVVLSVAWLT